LSWAEEIIVVGCKKQPVGMVLQVDLTQVSFFDQSSKCLQILWHAYEFSGARTWSWWNSHRNSACRLGNWSAILALVLALYFSATVESSWVLADFLCGIGVSFVGAWFICSIGIALVMSWFCRTEI
jgi:hypothetical protein